MTIQMMINKLQKHINDCDEKEMFKNEIQLTENIIDRLKEYMFLASALGITLDVIRDNAGDEFIQHLNHEIDIFNIAVDNILGGQADA